MRHADAAGPDRVARAQAGGVDATGGQPAGGHAVGGAEADGNDGLLGAALLWHARDAIADALGARHERPAPPVSGALLSERRATFVTLELAGLLRGCIGSLEATRSLERDVRHNAVAAAIEDPRFAPLAPRELAAVRIGVSLLEPAQRLVARDEADAVAQLVPQVDGLILRWRGGRATFLPQVWEQVDEGTRFVRLLKRKAGLPDSFWSSDLELWRYRVSKWTESTT